MKIKIDWKVTVTVFLTALGIIGFLATIILMGIDNYVLATVVALFTAVSFAIAAGICEGESNEQDG